MTATTSDGQLPRPGRRVQVAHHEPGESLLGDRDDPREVNKVCPLLLRLPPDDERNADFTYGKLGASRIPGYYKRLRTLGLIRGVIFGFTVAILCIVFAVLVKRTPEMVGFGIFGIIHGVLNLNPLDYQYEMASLGKARPNVLFTIRIVYYTLGWLALSILSLVIGVTGIIDERPGRLSRRKIRLRVGRTRGGLTGLSISQTEKALLYSTAACSIIASLFCLLQVIYVCILHTRKFGEEEIALAPYLKKGAVPSTPELRAYMIEVDRLGSYPNSAQLEAAAARYWEALAARSRMGAV